jgi:hypothetical protein
VLRGSGTIASNGGTDLSWTAASTGMDAAGTAAPDPRLTCSDDFMLNLALLKSD